MSDLSFSRRTALAGAGALLAGCGGSRPVVVDAWTGMMQDFGRQLFFETPDLVAFAGPALQSAAARRTLCDRSVIGEERRRTAAMRRVTQITSFDAQEIPSGRASRHAALVERLRAAADLAQIGFGRFEADVRLRPYALDPVGSAFMALPQLFDATPPFADLAGAQAFVDRLRAAPDAFAGDIARAEGDGEKGFVPPLVLLDRTISVLDALASAPLEASPYRVAFLERAQALAGPLDAAQPTAVATSLRALLGEIDLALRSRFTPAYQRAAGVLRGMRSKASSQAGYARSPDALVLYRRCLDAVLGPGFDASAARAGAETRLAALQLELDQILRGQGLADGSVGARLAQVRAAPRSEALDPATMRNKVRADIAALAARAGELFAERFGPGAPVAVEIAAAPAWRTVLGLGPSYRAADSGAPAAILAPLGDPARLSAVDEIVLAVHWGTPGRHVGESLSGLANDPVAPALRFLAARPSMDGWAAYGLSLADEMGLGQSGPLARLGLLAGQAQIAAAALMEFDLNSAEATWEAALAGYMEASGVSRAQAERLGERILAEPGAGIAPEFGRATIADLREKARVKLGARFDLKSFHTVVLAAMPGPLSYLRQSVDDWLARI